jgi:hypothetical protein
VAYFETLFRYLLGGTEDNLKQVTQYSGRYLKPGNLEQKTGALSSQPRRCV